MRPPWRRRGAVAPGAGPGGGLRPAERPRRRRRRRCGTWPTAGRHPLAAGQRHRPPAGAAPAGRGVAVATRPRARREPARPVGVARRGPPAGPPPARRRRGAARPVALPGPAHGARLAGDGGRSAVVVDRAPGAPGRRGGGAPRCRLTLHAAPHDRLGGPEVGQRARRCMTRREPDPPASAVPGAAERGGAPGDAVRASCRWRESGVPQPPAGAAPARPSWLPRRRAAAPPRAPRCHGP